MEFIFINPTLNLTKEILNDQGGHYFVFTPIASPLSFEVKLKLKL